jgi:putative oxidoreductase
MAPFMRKYGGETYAILRIVVGLMFLLHGASKLFGFPQAAPDAPPFILYVAGPIELVGGILIAVGLLTRWAAFICSGLMAAAYWMAHGTKDLFPMLNGGELAVLYCFVFLFIAARGAGIWSVDDARGSTS